MPAYAGNETNDSFSQAKKYLKQIYADHRETIYCGAKYGNKKTFDSIKPVITVSVKNKEQYDAAIEAGIDQENIYFENIIVFFGLYDIIIWRYGPMVCYENSLNLILEVIYCD